MSKPTAAQIAQEDALVAVIDSSRRIHKDDVDEKSILATVNEYRSYRLDLSKCFTCKPEPLDFVLAGLKAGTVGALIGTGGVSKSMMAIIEGIHVASGADLLATGAVPKGNVAILALEDDEQSIHHRLHAIGKHLTPSQIKEAATNLHIYPCTLSIMSLEGAVAQALAKDCRLLIVDTLRRAHDRDENDTKEMSQVLSLMEAVAKKSGAAVLFVHHQGKAAITGGTASEATSARGATVLIDNSRFCMALSNIHEKECGKLGIPVDERRRYIRCSYPKLSYCAPIPDIILRKGDGGVLVKTGLLFSGEEKPKQSVKAAANDYARASRGGDDEKTW